jgi:MoaA/NifB/PqqE/SkfB family radical SAM enzyme
MLADGMPANCSGCHLQEKGRSDPNSISSRLYYNKELGTKIGMDFYDNVENFSLKHVDLRWTNACNQACVYCSPEFSSKWAQEMGVKIKSRIESRQEVKEFVFENVGSLENVYLAGGEPMLIKENLEFLQLLKEKNPNCNIRVNTNLSTTQTGIFELLCDFKNVHWTVSVETKEAEYEYIRHHGSWKDFVNNLDIIRKLDHKISFNMLHFILNYNSIFDCVDYLKGIGFNDNSFIIGPLYAPRHYNILNLPEAMLDKVKDTLKQKLQEKPTGYLKNSYQNLLTYYSSTPWQKDMSLFLQMTKTQDERRNVSCRKVFGKLFMELNA